LDRVQYLVASLRHLSGFGARLLAFIYSTDDNI